VSVPNPYLPTQRYFPEDPQFLQRELNNSYVDIAKSINIREIGVYSQSLTATGQVFEYLTDTTSQEAQRHIYKIGAIATGTTVSTNHNIESEEFTMFTRIYGVALTDTNVFEPLPYASVTANANVELSVTQKQIVIKNGAAAPNITQVIVVVEFI